MIVVVAVANDDAVTVGVADIGIIIIYVAVADNAIVIIYITTSTTATID